MDQIKLLRRRNRILLVLFIVTLVVLVLDIIIQSRDYYYPESPENTDFHIVSLENGQVTDKGKTSLKDEIKVFNYGKPIHSLFMKSYVFLKLDSKCYPKSKTKEILLKGYYTGNYYQYNHSTDQYRRTTDDKNLVLISAGGKDNNFLFNKLSDEFYKESGCYLQKTTYLKIEYEDESRIKHTEFYKIEGFDSYRIDNLSGEKIITESKNISSVDLKNTTVNEISTLFGI